MTTALERSNPDVVMKLREDQIGKNIDISKLYKLFSSGPSDSWLADIKAKISLRLPAQLKGGLKKAVRLRNKLAHGKPVLDSAQSYTEVKNCFHDTFFLMSTFDIDGNILTDLGLEDFQLRPFLMNNGKVVDSNQFVEVRIRPRITSTFNQSSRLMLSLPQEFIGQEHLLCKLQEMVTASQVDCLQGRTRRILLHGPPGIGKTAVARKLSSRLANVFRKQYCFQASNEASLLADISIFLTTEGLNGSGREQFRNALQQSKSCLLLIFEDVQNPEMIIPLLPSDKHCVIFTSCSDLIWRELHLIPRHVTSVEVKALTTNESICLIRGILDKAKKPELLSFFSSRCCLHNFTSFLEEGLQNLPLAVRLLAFQLIEKTFTMKSLIATKSNLKNPDLPGERSTSDQRAAGRVHVRGFFHLINSALKNIPLKTRPSPLFLALAVLPASGVSVWLIEELVWQLSLHRKETVELLKQLTKTGLITLSLENHTIAMHQVTQQHVRSQLCHSRAQNVRKVVGATVSLACIVCNAKSGRGDQTTIMGKSCSRSDWLLSGLLHQQATSQNQLHAFDLRNTRVLEIELALLSLIANAGDVGMSSGNVYDCCEAVNFCLHHRNANDAITTRQMLQSCLAKHAMEVKKIDCTSLLPALDDGDNSLEAYWYSLKPTELYHDALQRLAAPQVDWMAKSHALNDAAYLLTHQNAYWHAIDLFGKLNFTLPVLLQEVRKRKSSSFIDNILWLSTVLRGADKFAHAEAAAFYAITLCRELKVSMRNHANLFLKSTDLLSIALSELGQSERALLWWDIAHDVLLEAYARKPPSSVAITLCHNSLRCCNQSRLGGKIKGTVINWVRRTLVHESSSELFQLDRVLVEEAFRHAHSYFVQCDDEADRVAEFLKGRLANYFAKMNMFSNACKPWVNAVAPMQSKTTGLENRQDPVEIRKAFIRLCRAVASSNVLPSCAEGISLMVDAYYTRYARHGNMQGFLAQMMSSATLQHVFKEFLAASGDDREDTSDILLPTDVNSVTPAGLLGAVSHLLRRRGAETCADAVDTFLDRSQGEGPRA